MLMFSVLARERGRFFSLLLLSLLLLTSWPAQTAHADGVTGTISSGTPVNGTITKQGVDSYRFTVPKGGGSFVISAAETGDHDPHFVPRIDLEMPGGHSGDGIAQRFYTRLWQNKAAEGDWIAKVSRADGDTSGGSYALTLIQLPVSAGTAISAGSPHSGSNTRGNVDVLTFAGVAGHTETLTLTTTGGNGFAPDVAVYTPTGGFAGGISCAASCSEDIPITADGAWVFLVSKLYGSDVTGTYTLSVNDKN